MEEETEQPRSFLGRLRGRKLWILVCASLVAAVAVCLLVFLINPSDESDTQEDSPAQQDAEQAQEPDDSADGGVESQPQEAPAQDSGEQPTTAPGTGEGAPATVVAFPDPADGGTVAPPPGGHTDLTGRWVLEMSGDAYGFTNCHITLNADGTISSPPEYDQVFQIMTSAYTWREGDAAFSASLQFVLKLGQGQVAVPVRMELAGNVAGSMLEISGEFTAEPEGEAYALYFQQGGFSMRR